MRRNVVFASILAAVQLIGATCELRAADLVIANFKLKDYQGKEWSLADFSRAKVIVVAFLGTDCPLANRYADRLVELAKGYAARDVSFLAIDSNQQDSLVQMGHFARVHRLEFPFLKDPSNVIADRFKAKRTPEICVLDGARAIRYRGRVDDQYGLGYTRPMAQERDLVRALDELLAGRAVTRPETELSGCIIGRVQREKPHGDITYTKQIAQILQARCVTCHRDGGIAPFALTSYKEAAAWAETIAEIVHSRRMPPWDASPKVGNFADDPSLSTAEIKLIEDWVSNGAPEGNAKELPEPMQFTEGWRIAKPDLVLSMPKAVRIPARGTLPYQYFTIDPGFNEDTWIRASEVRPGNPMAVHHVMVFVQAPGAPAPDLAGGIGDPVALWAPGMAPMSFPETTARFVPAGSKLVFQMHYLPTGVEQIDRTSVGFVLADPGKVQRAMKAELAMNTQLRIPPNDPDYSATADYRVMQNSMLYAMFPHMHLRGRAFRIEAIFPDKYKQVLLDVPRYRFDWQNRYTLAEPLYLPEGTVLHCEARFDNSDMNLSNPDPKAEVRFGAQTWDEMLVGYFDMVQVNQDLRLGLPAVQMIGDGKYEVQFRYRAKPGTKEVVLTGSFNNWSKTATRMTGPDAQNTFTAKVALKTGRHEYKFLVDGKSWQADPGNLQRAASNNSSILELPPRPKILTDAGE
jgi:peroxiredoxin/mono/diheme cytochrome c family protein